MTGTPVHAGRDPVHLWARIPMDGPAPTLPTPASPGPARPRPAPPRPLPRFAARRPVGRAVPVLPAPGGSPLLTPPRRSVAPRRSALFWAASLLLHALALVFALVELPGRDLPPTPREEGVEVVFEGGAASTRLPAPSSAPDAPDRPEEAPSLPGVPSPSALAAAPPPPVILPPVDMPFAPPPPLTDRPEGPPTPGRPPVGIAESPPRFDPPPPLPTPPLPTPPRPEASPERFAAPPSPPRPTQDRPRDIATGALPRDAAAPPRPPAPEARPPEPRPPIPTDVPAPPPSPARRVAEALPAAPAEPPRPPAQVTPPAPRVAEAPALPRPAEVPRTPAPMAPAPSPSVAEAPPTPPRPAEVPRPPAQAAPREPERQQTAALSVPTPPRPTPPEPRATAPRPPPAPQPRPAPQPAPRPDNPFAGTLDLSRSPVALGGVPAAPARGPERRMDPPNPSGRYATDSTFTVSGANLGEDWRRAMLRALQSMMYYPRDAVENGEDGTAILRFTVTRDGRVENLALVGPTGSRSLDVAAYAVVRGARIPPFPAGTPEDRAEIRLNARWILRRR